MKIWVEAGLDPSRFWRLTYREIDAELLGASQRIRRERNDLAWAAWHTAYLTAYAPANRQRFPKLETLLDAGSKRRQTVSEMKAAVAAWMVAGRC